MQVSVKLVIIFISFFITVTSTPIAEIKNDEVARIVNGVEVDITEIPYQASVKRRSLSGWSHLCGAVVISNRAILTAAHCVETYESVPTLLRVVVGTSYRLTGGKSYELSRAIVHEQYSSETLENDIALLGTQKAISFSSAVSAIPYASPNIDLPTGTEALVSGFGTIEYEGASSTTLRAARVYITNQSTCSRAYIRIASITSGMVCANATDPLRDACQGDSGGPLVANNTLVGIVSWGENCASLEYPGVYTRVSAYYSWITEKLTVI